MKCMIDGCGKKKTYSRGICQGCYASFSRLVHSREATWEELEDLGLCNPPDAKRGRKRCSVARSALEAARKKA
jgi:hypothetical protein